MAEEKETFVLDLDRLSFDDYMALEKHVEEKNTKPSVLAPFISKAIGIEWGEDGAEFRRRVGMGNFFRLQKKFWDEVNAALGAGPEGKN